MQLWHVDCFYVKKSEKKQIREKLFALPICLKAGHTFIKVFQSPPYQESIQL